MAKRLKKKIKFAVRKAMSDYYDKGLTNTAATVRGKINQAIDKIFIQ